MKSPESLSHDIRVVKRFLAEERVLYGVDRHLTKLRRQGIDTGKISVNLEEEGFRHSLVDIDASSRIMVSLVDSTKSIKLSPKEFDLMNLLGTHTDEVVLAEDIIRQVWKLDMDSVTAHYLRMHVGYLRKRLKAICVDPDIVKNRWGTGYMLEDKRYRKAV